MKKIYIIGTSCSGKTTLGSKLSKKTGITHIDLDDIHWQPGWKNLESEDFKQEIHKIIDNNSWIITGNYSVVRDIILKKADTVIWLDYSFLFTLSRAFKRSISRIIFKTPICNGNYENVKTTFFSTDSIIFWVIKTWKKRRIIAKELINDKNLSHINFIVFKNIFSKKTFLKELS